MDSLSTILKSKKLEVKEVKIARWQEDALEACKFFADSPKFKGSIFKCFKQNSRMAELALSDCKELSKPFSRYFLKVFNELNK